MGAQYTRMAAMKQTALQATAIRLPHTILREQTADRFFFNPMKAKEPSTLKRPATKAPGIAGTCRSYSHTERTPSTQRKSEDNGNGTVSVLPETTLEYDLIIAAGALKMPIEFFKQLKPKDALALKNRVTSFLFGEE